MTFGDQLRDQLPAINNFAITQTTLANTIRDFMKERAAIEKEYASKLEQVCKKHMKLKDKMASSVMGEISLPSGTPASAAAEELNKELGKYGSFFRAWEALLKHTDEIAQTRLQLSEKIHVEVTDHIKAVLLRKEEARKKHMAFAQKLVEERNKAFSDKDKSKQKYDELCDIVDAAKAKYDKATDDKLKEKLKRQWNSDIEEMNNGKNNYIMALNVANAFKKNYYYTDLPAVNDHMESMCQQKMESLKQLFADFTNLELGTNETVKFNLNTLLDAIKSIEPAQDTALFSAYQQTDWQEPYDFKFEPTLLWKDTDSMANDELAQIYLTNKMGKIRDKLEHSETEIQNKIKELDGLQSLFDAYSKNPSLGDAEEVGENMIETNRRLALLNGIKLRYTTSLSVLKQAIGDGTDGKRHTFAKAHFAIPTTCDYCGEKIWGTGLVCKDCGYTCHVRCEMKVPPYCADNHRKKKGKGSPSSSISVSPVPGEKVPTSDFDDSGSNTPQPAKVDRQSIQVVQSPPEAAPPSAPVGVLARAVFDYEAANPDELSIKEGDQIFIVTPDDGSGWIKAKKGSVEGLLPAAYLQADSGGGTSGDKVKAAFDFDAQNPDELTLRVGDEITVISKGDDGWWLGELNGQTGQFPAAYVE